MQRAPREGIHIAVTDAWIDITAADGSRARHTLRHGLTTLGGKRGDIALPAAGNDQLHLWDQPPKLVYVGVGEPPKVNGEAREECALRLGDRIEWCGVRLEFGGVPHATIEEIAVAAPPPVAPAAAPLAAAPPGMEASEFTAWRRLKAGLLVELGMADPSAARRWQDAVLRSEFEPDACARDVLGASVVPPADTRLVERCARLERDLVMAPVSTGSRGASRKIRNVARSGLAFIVAQFVVLSVVFLLVFLALFIVRMKWNWSVDEFLDRVRATIAGT